MLCRNLILILACLAISVIRNEATSVRSEAAVAAQHRFRMRHGFAAETETGEQLANEFQLMEPSRVRDFRKKIRDSEYFLTEIFPLIIDNDDVVTVSYKAVNPNKKDWIAAYTTSANITEVVPLKYGWCDDSADYLNTGVGSLTFNLTNIRDDITFYYFTNSTSYPVLVASTDDKVTFINPNQPLRPRIVPTGDYNRFQLLWSSKSSTTPTLKWGTESGVYTNTVIATTSKINRDDVCGYPANGKGWFDTGLIHTASLANMYKYAGKQLYYIFGDEMTSNFAEEHIFTVPPVPGGAPKNRPTRVVLFDDLGRGSDDMTYTWNEYGRPSYMTIKSIGAQVARGEIDMVYHGGDISYATGYLSVWDFYLDMIAPMASGTLYLTTVGNHESDWYDSASLYSNSDSGGECGVMTTRLIPQPAPSTTDAPWWSYEVGLIHFIGISTEHNYDVGSVQYEWLENDLASLNRTRTPWVVFGGHRAMYLNSYYGGAETSDIVVMDRMIEQLEPLLYKYRVNIGFYGHNHVVQRQSAVYNRTVVQHPREVVSDSGDVTFYHDNPQATVHFVIGTGGATFTKNSVDPKPEWNEMYFYKYGYTRLTAHNSTTLEWEWIWNETDEVMDHVFITQDNDFSYTWGTK